METKARGCDRSCERHERMFCPRGRHCSTWAAKCRPPPVIVAFLDGVGLVAKRVETLPRSEPSRVVLRVRRSDQYSDERSAEEVRVVAASSGSQATSGCTGSAHART